MTIVPFIWATGGLENNDEWNEINLAYKRNDDLCVTYYITWDNSCLLHVIYTVFITIYVVVFDWRCIW